MSAERRRLALALLLSLLFHALLLSLTFEGLGFGLPGFGFPWRERRIEATDLHVALVVPPQVTAAVPASTSVDEPLQGGSIEQPLAATPSPTPSVSLAPTPTPTPAPEAIAPKPRRAVRAKPVVPPKPAPNARPERDAAGVASPANAPARTDAPKRARPR